MSAVAGSFRNKHDGEHAHNYDKPSHPPQSVPDSASASQRVRTFSPPEAQPGNGQNKDRLVFGHSGPTVDTNALHGNRRISESRDPLDDYRPMPETHLHVYSGVFEQKVVR